MQEKFIPKTQEEYYQLTIQIIKELENKAIEREELIRILVLAIFSRTNMFLIGPPGVGKTYILNILINSIPEAKSFEYLVMAHTKPEELFGTSYVDENGKMQYDITNSILDSHFPFLDEIFKGSSQILNTLLGITHPSRKFFMRGVGEFRVPMVCMLAASNEFPQDESLDALDDRFLFRYEVLPIQKMENYERYVAGDFDSTPYLSVQVTLDDLNYVYNKARETVKIPPLVRRAYISIREKMIQLRVKVSDRKINLSLDIFKVSAWLNNRNEIDFSDLFLLNHIMWRNFLERDNVREALKEIIFGNRNEIDKILFDIERELEKNIGFIKQELNSFINKTESFSGAELEKFFNKKIQEFNTVLENFRVLENAINNIVNRKKFVDEVMEQCKNNIFIYEISQEVFDNKNIVVMNNLRMQIRQNLKKLEKFNELVTNVYDYMNYNPAMLNQ
ncbi:AAA family ATPase [Caminibacter sp.]